MAIKLKLGNRSKIVQLVPKETPLQRLIDRLGEVHELAKPLVAEEKKLKEELKSYGAGSFNGIIFDATIEQYVRQIYKTEKLEEFVPEELLKKCRVPSPYLTIKTTRKANLT